MSLFEDQDKKQNVGFTVVMDGMDLKISEHEISNSRIFYVLFPDNRKPLSITKALPDSKRMFWTSVPQGRQVEAEKVGLLIDQYFTKK